MTVSRGVVARLGLAALTSPSLDAVLDRLVEEAATALDVELTKVLELDRAHRRLRLRAGVGWREGLVGAATVGIGRHSQAGYTLASDEPVVVADCSTETRFRCPRLLREHHVVSGMSAVIRSADNGDVWGVFGVHTTRRRDFSEGDADFVQSLANLVTLRLEHDERVAAERALITQERFLASAAHELGNPLATLQGYHALAEQAVDRLAEVGAAPKGEVERLRFANRMVVEQAERLTRLVEDLRDLVRSDSGQLRIEPRLLDLGPFVAQVRDETLSERVVLEVPDEPVFVSADPPRMKQVLHNLLSNAFRYAPTGPVELRLRPRSEASNGGVELSVRDHGPGIPEAVRDRLFQRFSKGRDQTNGGFGLGLYICAEIVRLHGGEIRAEFPQDGGTRMVVTLPTQT